MKTVSKISAIVSALVLMGAGCFGGGARSNVLDGGVFKSPDAGETWADANIVPTVRGVSSLGGVNVIAIQGDPHHAGTLYASTLGEGVFVTNDAGGEWRRFGAIGQRTVRMVAVDPVLPCLMYAASGARVLKTEDCGRAWNVVYETPKTDQEVRAVVIAPDNRMLVYAGLSDGVFLVSQNGGGSWAVAHRFDGLIRKIVIDQAQPTRVYIVTDKTGLWRSDNRGASFESLTKQLNEFVGARRGWDLLLDPSSHFSLLYASTYGLLKSADGGQTWSSLPLLTAPGEAKIYGLAANPKNAQEMYYSAVIGGKPLLYKTTDGGANWKNKKLPTTRIPASIFVRPDNPAELFLGMYELQQ